MKSMTVIELNDHLMGLIKNERKLTQEILSHILLFDKCGGYLKLGYASMFQYLCRHCGYSEDQAYRRLKAARLLNQVPEVAEKLQSGAINLSQAAQAQKAFEQVKKETGRPCSVETQKSLIEAIQNSNTFETKKTLSTQLNLKPVLDESVKPQSNKTVRLETNLTEEQFKKLTLIKNLLSHQIPDQNTGKILEAVFDFFIDKKQKTKTQSFMETPKKGTSNGAPIMGAQVNDNKKETQRSSSTETSQQASETLKESISDSSPKKTDTKSRYIPAETKATLLHRSQGACEYIGPNGERCGSRYQVQIEHIIHFCLGGDHQLSNLKNMCKNHNAHTATEAGIGFETTSFFR